MKLILTQPEIEAILRKHINENVTLASGNDFAIDFVATRSGDGTTATIDIPYLGVTTIPGIAAEAAATKAAEAAPQPGPAPTAPAPRQRRAAAAPVIPAATPMPPITVQATDPTTVDADEAAQDVAGDTPFPNADDDSAEGEDVVVSQEEAEETCLDVTAEETAPPADTGERRSLFAK